MTFLLLFLILCFPNSPWWHPSIIRWICLCFSLPKKKKKKNQKSNNLYWICCYVIEEHVLSYLTLVTVSFFEGLCSEEVHIIQKCSKPFPSLHQSPSISIAPAGVQKKSPQPFWVPANGNLKYKVEFTGQYFFLCSMLPFLFSFTVMLPCTYKSSVYFQCRILMVVAQNKYKCWGY